MGSVAETIEAEGLVVEVVVVIVVHEADSQVAGVADRVDIHRVIDLS